MNITTVIVTSNRAELFERAVTSVLREAVPVFVVINGEDFKAKEICEKFNLRRLFLKKKVMPAEARNLAVTEVDSEWIHFLDDDAYVEEDFYSKAHKIMAENNCDILGGPNLTPPDSNAFQYLSGKALSSLWGAGPCSRRYSEQIYNGYCGEESLILCNLFVKKEVFLNHIFPSHFICGEENSFLAKVKRGNGKFYFSSELSVLHERRVTLNQFFHQIFKYGVGRGQNIQTLDFSFFHIIPLLSFFAILCLAINHNYKALIGLGSFYFLLNAFFSKKDLKLFFIFPVIHFIYAMGCLRGIFFLGDIAEHKFLFFNSSKLFGKKNF